MMKQIFLSVLALFISTNLNAQTVTLQQLWEAKVQLPVPESVVHLASKKQLYVSLIDG
ncbi:MAG: ATP-binding protein, partial [Chitinophagaceae bacterium]